MSANIEIDRHPATSVELSFYAISILFNICLIAQVITVGIAYFDDPTWWRIHVWLVRGYGGLSLLLAVR